MSELYFNECSALFGEFHIFSGRLRSHEYRDVLLHDAAIYDADARLIPDSAFMRGVPKLHLLGAVEKLDMVPRRVSERLPPARYFWIGVFHAHFGHFLVSTLSRFWALGEDVVTWTFLYVGPSPEDLWKLDHVRTSLTALGIAVGQLRQVSGPLLIPFVTIAQPSFVENFGASPAFVDTLGRIRKYILPSVDPGGGSRTPIYVTKERVQAGVRGIANEADVTAMLTSKGVSVVSPETMSFRDQVAFWCGHRYVTGFASSAFHLAAFATDRRLVTISHEWLASANQALLDRVAGNRHRYVHAGPGVKSQGQSHSFTDLVHIVDPERFTRAVLAHMQDFETVEGQSVGPEPRTVWPEALGYDSFGVELAREGWASQSSTYELDEGYNSEAQGALSGRLNGAYQCSTRRQEDPWWQVKLAVSSILYEIRIYNRAENSTVMERLAGFQILTSSDGEVWCTIHTHTGAAPAREPFRWQSRSTVEARYIRIRLPGDTWLHLDQVEVFGRPLCPSDASA